MPAPKRIFLDVKRSATGHSWAHRLNERQEMLALAIAQGHGVPDIVARVLAGFYRGGRAFRWTFHDAVAVGTRGYARYRFSYTSTAPEAQAGCEGQAAHETQGARVCFDGIACLELDAGSGLIRHYSEVFDRGMALAQQNFAPERIAKIGRRYGDALKARAEWAAHLREG